jgi:hypothetical protein
LILAGFAWRTSFFSLFSAFFSSLTHQHFDDSASWPLTS